MQSYGCSAWLAGLLEQGSGSRFGMGAAAGSELLISEPKTRVRPEAAASAHRAHPVSSSRDQQPETGNSPYSRVLHVHVVNPGGHKRKPSGPYHHYCGNF
eukprot:COSAG01_NODE_1181_length_11357_cov_130.760082_3_plen_100_part_00